MKNNLFYFVQLIFTYTSLLCKICWISNRLVDPFVKTTRQRFICFIRHCIQVFPLFGSFRLKQASVRDLQPCKFLSFFQTFHLCVIIFLKSLKHLFVIFFNIFKSFLVKKLGTVFIFLIFNNNFYQLLFLFVLIYVYNQSKKFPFISL